MTETAKTALQKVLSLRQLSHENQTRTTRSQNAVLEALNSSDLADVSTALVVHKTQFGW
jgi:hypothetical protein